MTVEENLWHGRLSDGKPAEAKRAADTYSSDYPRLAARRRHRRARSVRRRAAAAGDFSRALMMDPQVLLVDEPSIGLEPRFIDMVFEILGDLQQRDGKTIVIVEQNAKKGLEFADIGYVLVSAQSPSPARPTTCSPSGSRPAVLGRMSMLSRKLRLI